MKLMEHIFTKHRRKAFFVLGFLVVILVFVLFKVKADLIPSATNVNVSGTSNVGQNLAGSYTYNDGDWEFVGSPGFSLTATNGQILRFDSSGTPYVAYTSTQSKITVMKYNSGNSSWELVGAANFSEFAQAINGFVIDSTGTPYVSFQDGHDPFKYNFMKYDGANWVYVGGHDVFGSSLDTASSLEINPMTDIPYFTYIDGDNSNKMTVMKLNLGNDSWEQVGPTVSDVEAASGSILFDSTGSLYAYYEISVGDTTLDTDTILKKYNSGANTWDQVGPTILAGSTANGSFLHIGIDTAGHIYYGYDETSGGGPYIVKVFKLNTGTNTWDQVGPDVSPSNTYYQSFTIGHSGELYVLYKDTSSSYKAIVKKYSSSTNTWDIQGSADFTTNTGNFALSTDATGNLYVVYNDGGHGGYVTVMKFITDPEGVSTFKWYRDGVVITDAINNTYTLTSADAGHSIKFEVTPVSQGLVIGTAVQSSGVLINSIPVATSVNITGTPDVGQTLTGHYVYSDADKSWAVVGSGDVSSDTANALSLALNSTGTPYIVYGNGKNSNANVMKYDGANWVAVGAPDFSAGGTNYTSIAIDPLTDVPYVAYQDQVNSNMATVMKFNGSSWVTVGAAGFSTADVYNTFIAINPTGIPYIVFEDGVGQTATVMKYDGANWVTVGTAGFSPGQIDYPSLAFDPTGIPYVSFVDLSGRASGAMVMKFNGSSWVNVGTPDFSPGSAGTPSLKIDSTGTPYVGFSDNSARPAAATVMKFDGANWVNVGLPDFSAGDSASTRLALDSSGAPYLAFSDGTNSNNLTVMKYNGASWILVGAAGFSAGSDGPGYGFAIDLNGIPYISYYDSITRDKAIVMKAGMTDPEATSTFKWYRNGVVIPGATASTYLLASTDAGTTLTFEVTPVAQSGSNPGLPMSADLVINAESTPPPVPTPAPKSSGGQYLNTAKTPVVPPVTPPVVPVVEKPVVPPVVPFCDIPANYSSPKCNLGAPVSGCTGTDCNPALGNLTPTVATVNPAPATVCTGADCNLIPPPDNACVGANCNTNTSPVIDNNIPVPATITPPDNACVGADCNRIQNIPTSSTTTGSAPLSSNTNIITNTIAGGITTAVKSVIPSATIDKINTVVNIPLVSVTTKTIATAGVAAGAAISVASAVFASPVAAPEMTMIPFRIWTLLISFLGIKKERRKWGIIYDSVTMQPLDPAYVVLNDGRDKEIATSLTDLDGRYGFPVEPGIYSISVNKTDYVFPSVKLAGKESDVLHKDLYFGGEIEVKESGEIITKNIPMDRLNFSWNEWAKNEKHLMKFYDSRNKLVAEVTNVFFWVAFTIATLALIFAPVGYNMAIFALYVLLFILRNTNLMKIKKTSSIVDKEGIPLSFAIVRIYSADIPDVEFAHHIADKFGHFYCLVPNGKYIVKIEEKTGEHTYNHVFTSEPIKVSNGLIERQFGV